MTNYPKKKDYRETVFPVVLFEGETFFYNRKKSETI
jgi:hypothetical protein